MLKGRDIIYTAGHDFALEDCRIGPDHIAHELSRHNRVLYVESVGLRPPRLDSNDLSRIGRKLKRFIRPPRRVAENMWVMTPLAIPLHHSPAIRRANKVLMTAHIRLSSGILGFRNPVLFVFQPHLANLVGTLGESVSVYYCTDEHAEFPGVDRDGIRLAEEELLRKVTLGFATAPEILNNKKRLNPNFYYSPHGVDFDSFARAQDPSLDIPEDMRGLKGPVIGYFGAIDRWLDLALIETLARARPNWSFVFIGKPVIDLSGLSALSNVFFVGKRPFQDLPRYGRAFDAMIIPFQINELTRSVSPIKMKEYLAMGKPVVSTPLPAVVEFAEQSGVVNVASDPQRFLTLLDGVLTSDSRELALMRQHAVRHDTWAGRTAEVGRVIDGWLERQSRPALQPQVQPSRELSSTM